MIAIFLNQNYLKFTIVKNITSRQGRGYRLNVLTYSIGGGIGKKKKEIEVT